MEDAETLLARIQADLEQLSALTGKLFVLPSGVQDGPGAPGEFIWRGKSHRRMRKLGWRLVKVLWGRSSRMARFDELGELVWGDHVEFIDLASVASVRRDTNKFFADRGIALRLATSGGMVYLQSAPASENLLIRSQSALDHS